MLKLTLEEKDGLRHLGNALNKMQKFVLGGFGNYARDRQYMYHAMQIWYHAKSARDLLEQFCYLPVKIVDALLYQGRYQESLEYAMEQHEFLASSLGKDHHSSLAMLFNKARFDVYPFCN